MSVHIFYIVSEFPSFVTEQGILFLINSKNDFFSQGQYLQAIRITWKRRNR